MSRNDVLVDADWLQEHLDDPTIAIVEVDEDTSAYEKNHIRNAIRIDWTQDLQDPVRRDFVDQEGFEKLLSDKGIGNDHTVVLYGGNNNWFASYAYWYFKLYGHESVKLLDGGRKKWELDARELVAGDEVPERPKTDYKAKAQDTSIRAFRDDVVAGPPAAGAVPAPGSRPVRPQHPVVQERQRRRHLQVGRRAQGALRRGERRPGQGHHRLLPHR